MRQGYARTGVDTHLARVCASAHSTRAVSRHRQAARSRPDNQRLRATAADSVTQEAGTPLQFRNLLLPILDSNEFLTDGSKQVRRKGRCPVISRM